MGTCASSRRSWTATVSRSGRIQRSVPFTRTDSSPTHLHLGRAVVTEHAVRRHLLPEVVLVDELDREPEAVVPRVVVGGVTGEHRAAGRAHRVEVGALRAPQR